MAPKAARPASPRPGAGQTPAKDGGGNKGSKTKRAESASKERPKADGKKTKRASSALKARRTMDDKSEDDEAATGSAEGDADADLGEPSIGKAKRPNPATLQTVTGGQVGIIGFIDDDEEPEPAPRKPESSVAAASDDGPPVIPWDCAKWLREIKSLHNVLAEATCYSRLHGGVPLEGNAALSHVRELGSRDELLEREVDAVIGPASSTVALAGAMLRLSVMSVASAGGERSRRSFGWTVSRAAWCACGSPWAHVTPA